MYGAFVCVAHALDSRLSKFIATFEKGVDPSGLVSAIAAHAADPALDWTGKVSRTHHTIRVLVVDGVEGTCDVISGINGILHCEPDSIVTHAD